MLEVIIKLIGVLMVLIGIIFIYDARILTKRFFSFGDQNDASQRIKNFRFYNCHYWRTNHIFCIKMCKMT